MDIKSSEERSRKMAKIKNSKTKPEMYIRTLLFHHGLRYRVNYAACYGKPDLYFIRHRVAVFVNGCYWHRHKGCKYAYTPKSNVDFWLKKLEGNRKHDIEVTNKLIEQHIRVLIIWECTAKKMSKIPSLEEEYLNKIFRFIDDERQEFLEL
ncbi:very short patch repair endonuclease [Caproiciproducens sp. R2]|uniref:very short patch repair endonuclease n=1 Tax=Caproiciproducens sp. R2 TaxID=3435187 RepID=UPI004034D40B